jgi:general secretion pathway protein I
MKATKPGTGGFTLLEILVALAVLGIAAMVIFQLFSANTRSLSNSDAYVAAVVKAEGRMREVLDNDALSAQTWTETSDDGYCIDVAIAETLQPRTDGLPVQMFDIALTLHWKKDSKEKTITLRSMKMMARKV